MRLIITDAPGEGFTEQEEAMLIADNGKIRNCMGCFGCWIKNPGKCVLRDGYENMGEILARADEVEIISGCRYGTYSVFIRNILDRSIPYLLPYFRKVGQDTHHKPRYRDGAIWNVYFYGADLGKEEKEAASELVKRNAINFNVKKYTVTFCRNRQEAAERARKHG